MESHLIYFAWVLIICRRQIIECKGHAGNRIGYVRSVLTQLPQSAIEDGGRWMIVIRRVVQIGKGTKLLSMTSWGIKLADEDL